MHCNSQWRHGACLLLLTVLSLSQTFTLAADAEPAGPRKIDGYRGIWFDLGQRSEYGSKYSGGLGTYTAKHRPIAIYAPEARKTFFVYGGTTQADQRHLLAMVSYYDHERGVVPKPTVVHDKETVNDPHDNPSIALDGQGHIWVFVSGRGRVRPGFKYRSMKPHDIEAFELISEEEFTYPQPVWIEDHGFLHLFTKYTDGRELYWNTSDAGGRHWSAERKLAGMGGHYQMTEARGARVVTAFNMHPGGVVDKRTNLYFVQTDDQGRTWQTVGGETVATPLTNRHNAALVRDYETEGRLVYLKDITFDRDGRPVLLYITSGHHQPGPESDPRTWTIAHWSGERWNFHEVTRASHNYDMGSLYVEPDGVWRLIGPTEPGSHRHGTGGEMVMWTSDNQGKTWNRIKELTKVSPRNHAYARRPVNAHPDFYALWADGNSERMSESYLYFCNQAGNAVWRLPYDMKENEAAPIPVHMDSAREDITAHDLLRHIRVLASDEFEGRSPGSVGEDRTVEYLIQQFQSMGLEPGHPDGSWIQNVPLAGITSQVATRLEINNERSELVFPQDIVAWSPRQTSRVEIDSNQLVFVGYGVQAPEYDWDDYKGADVRGKTLLMLVNDPQVPDPGNPAQLDESIFKGKAMTYYGRWTYKYEIAARLGAAAAFVIHETGPAGYPYFVVINSWGRENFSLRTADGGTNELAVAAWMSRERAENLFRAAGLDFEELKQRALRRDFQPVPLPARIAFNVTNTVREVPSRNVIARRTGSDPARAGEYVLYNAHWDHLGRNEQLEGDQIFNGATDNASGTAGLLELAEAFAQLPEAPPRTVLFLAVTAEERGLLGARYYAEHPLYPLHKTLAVINMDSLNMWGRKKDMEVIGRGNSTLDDVIGRAAQRRGMTLVAESAPEKGFFYRSDHFEFAKQGVPALYLSASGNDFVGREEGYGRRKREDYVANDYHKVSDEVKPDWDPAGAVEDLRMLFEVGWETAWAEEWPQWKPGTEFKAVREESLAGESAP